VEARIILHAINWSLERAARGGSCDGGLRFGGELRSSLRRTRGGHARAIEAEDGLAEGLPVPMGVLSMMRPAASCLELLEHVGAERHRGAPK
jgi:hypothetical protein